MAASVEAEVKLVCHEIGAHIASSTDLQWTVVQPRHFEDNFIFDLPDETLANHGSILRVRVVDGLATLTYKGLVPESSTSEIKVREELETGVEQATTLATIFERLGMRRVFRYQKYRTIYRISFDSGELLAMFDETPMGNFLEIEGEEARVVAVAERLGYRSSEFVKASYIGLQVGFCKARGVPLEDLVFNTDVAPARSLAAGVESGPGGSGPGGSGPGGSGPGGSGLSL